METFLGLIAIFAVFLLVQRLRFRSLVAAGQALGFTVTAGPTLEQRETWNELARHVHSHVPTSWGASAEGRVQGLPVRMQAQEIRRTVNGNREWHTLVILDLANTTQITNALFAVGRAVPAQYVRERLTARSTAVPARLR